MIRLTFKALLVCLMIALTAGTGYGAARSVSNLNEPGSLLAFPLVENIHFTTIINIANTADTAAVLECYMITQGIDGTIDEKKDFVIQLTGKEKFVWMSSQAYNQRGNQIQGFQGRRGYMFCYAIDNVHDQLEIGYDFLKGDATLLSPHMGVAFNYNAIPHQTGEVLGDRILRLDGNEYTMASSQIMFEGLAEVPCCIGGILAVAAPGIDFVESTQPEFDLNLFCWNEVETKFSRHLPFKDFALYDLTRDLQLDIQNLFTLGWHCATTSTRPLWAVFHQSLAGIYGWGGNVWQHPQTLVPAVITLPPVPIAR